MTPKEKAEDLLLMFSILPEGMNSEVKQCALIAVGFAKEFVTGDLEEAFDKILYLTEVEEEIEKL